MFDTRHHNNMFCVIHRQSKALSKIFWVPYLERVESLRGDNVAGCRSDKVQCRMFDKDQVRTNLNLENVHENGFRTGGPGHHMGYITTIDFEDLSKVVSQMGREVPFPHQTSAFTDEFLGGKSTRGIFREVSHFTFNRS